MSLLIIAALISAVCGFLFVGGLNYMMKQRLIKEAHAEGREYITLAQQSANENMSDLKRQLEEERFVAFEKSENEIQPLIGQIEEMKAHLEDREVQLKEQMEERNTLVQSQQSQVDRYQSQVRRKHHHLSLIKKKLRNVKSRYRKELQDKFSINLNKITEELSQLIKNETSSTLKKDLQLQEELAQQNAERNAKAIIHIALNRFARAYCPERGVNYVNLLDELTKKRVFGPNRSHLRQLEELCGVDLIYREDMNSISVSGFDPVRREWALASLNKMLTEKKLNTHSIRRISHNVKRELLKKIKRDGKKLFKELDIKNISSEITHTMGALRYRYSFAQNQYFHCSEVGFLCGLLAAELGLPVAEARRIGVLHDIGKAMDHSLEGGHAVIGADFIQKHGESESIVHAVRAHHYDEEPRTDLAFLVIAADALSGARPGARRSTADSYMQKMGQLQEIGNSFEQTEDTFIMSAGREVRVQVDSKKVSDRDILVLSKEIAQKIEEECNYPGLIKVTVVRQTQAVEYAK